MAKIDGKYLDTRIEDLYEKIVKEDSITKSQHLVTKYLAGRCLQVEKILANSDGYDIDLLLVVEQLWEDLKLAKTQLRNVTPRSDFYAKYNGLLK